MENYGATIKQIRIGKGMTQKEVCMGIISQGNYSKFESGENPDIKVTILQALLLRLNLPMDEFFYIHNGYKNHEKMAIQRALYESLYNDPEILEDHLQRAKHYLQHEPNDQDMQIFAQMIKGLIVLAKTGDFEQTCKLVEPIWEKLSKRNELLVSDIYILNNILFVFPLETAMDILQFLLRQIERYGDYRQVKRIYYSLVLNASLLQIRAQQFSEGTALLDTVLPNLQQQRLYAHLAVGYIRKGICLHNLSKDGTAWIEKGKHILLAVELNKMWNTLEEEIKKYTN